MEDIRWVQRFNNYKKALKTLSEAVEIVAKPNLDNNIKKLIEEGLIQRFEFTFELAWNVMKDFCEYQDAAIIKGSRDAIRISFSKNLISDGHIWFDMLEKRIKTTHTYDDETIEEIKNKIIENYLSAFIDLEINLEKLV